MFKKLVTSLLTVVAVLTMSVPVFAGERAGAFSVSPFAGGYTFDGVQHLDTAPVYGLRLGYDLTKYLGVEAVGTYLSTDAKQSELSFNALSYRLDILFNLMPDGPLVPYLVVGGGGITFGHGRDGFKMSGRTTDGTANAGFGIKYFLTDSIALRGDARQLFIFEEHNSVMYNWEYTAGLTFLFGGRTAPAPVVAAAAPPPLAPAPAPVQVAEPLPAPAPPPPPPAPICNLTVNPGTVTKGESASLNWTSQNATDCDIQPNIGPVRLQGSMQITPVVDTVYTLACSGSGQTASSAASITVVVPPPPEPKPEMLCYTIDIEFDTAKWNIKPQYHDELVKLADFMTDYPDLKGVIEGHTDNKAGKAYNQKLSEKRAKSVRDYIVNKLGIEGTRLATKGYGFSKPIASNKTAVGRQKNRRVIANFACVDKHAKKKR